MRWQPPARVRQHRLRVSAQCPCCDDRTVHALRERSRQFAVAFYLVCRRCRRVRLLGQQPERAA